MKRILAVSVAALAAGCIQLADEDRWGEQPVFTRAKPAAPRQDVRAAWRGEADPWAETKRTPADANVIGGESAFVEKGAKAGAPAAGRSSGSALGREVAVLAARVERLERLVGATGPAPAAAADAAPTAAIYKVHPDGRTAWISAGSAKGVRKGQGFRVVRGGTVVAQVQVARVWPNVAELSVLWANGELKRGDGVVPK